MEEREHRPERDLLHPLAKVNWERYYKWENAIKPTHCAVLNDAIAVLSNMNTIGDVLGSLHVSTSGLNSWTTIAVPYGHSSLTTYQSMFVLVGGFHQYPFEVTNQLWSSTTGLDLYTSLPAMPTSRYWTSSVSGGSPEVLVVAGGIGSDSNKLDVVEVLLDDHWATATSLPSPCFDIISTFHESNFYFAEKKSLFDQNIPRTMYIRSYASLIESATNNDIWKTINVPCKLFTLASFSSHLICIDETYTIRGYSCSTLSWHKTIDEGDVRQRRISSSIWNFLCLSVVVLSTGQLVIVDNWNMYRATLSVATFDPDSRFCSDILSRLEAVMGIEIISVLAPEQEKLTKMVNIAREDVHKDPVSYVQWLIHEWSMGHTPCPPTWRELLQAIQAMGHLKLRQQIESFMKGEMGYLEAYHHFIATKESLDLLFLKFLFLSPPRLGKTTMRRRLLKEIVDLMSAGEAGQSEPSTGTVESSDVVVTNLSSTTAVITESEWSKLADLRDEVRMLMNGLMGTIQNTPKYKPSQLDDVNRYNQSTRAHSTSFESSPLVFGETQHKRPASLPSSGNSSSHHKVGVTQNIVKMSSIFKEAMEPDHWKHVKPMFKVYMRMEDTGGQPELMDMLPALTLGPGLYLLFINLQNDLDHHYKLTYCDASGESTPPIESVYSVKEMLLSSLSSISCFSACSPVSRLSTSHPYMANIQESSKSIAFIVGTHRDKVSDERVKIMNEDLKKVLMPTQFYKQNIVQFASQEDLIIAMDNMAGGADEVQKVKKILEDSFRRHFSKLRIPAVWLFFNLLLRQQDEKITTLDHCMQLSITLGMFADETKVALWFLHHHAGVLMYFPNVPQLKDLVILDVQVVYDSVTAIILQAMNYKKVGHSDADIFKRTGKFKLSHIIQTTREVSGDYIAVDKLVALLEFLHIIARIPNHHSSLSSSSKKETLYMLPCILRNATKKILDSISKKTQEVPSLLFHFKCGAVPIGVFPSLIACLLSNPSFVLLEDEIYKNCVKFHFGDSYTLLCLVCSPTYYECMILKFSSDQVFPRSECASIRKDIESTLSTVSSGMNYGSFTDYEFAFDCPLHPADGREHLCVVDRMKISSGMMLCLRNSGKPEPLQIPATMKVWFGQPLQKLSSAVVSTGMSSKDNRATDSSDKPTLCSLISFKCGDGCIDILNEIGADYHDFGILLLKDERGNEVDRLVHKHLKDPKAILRDIMKLWIDGNGRPVSWQTLVDVLKEVGLKALAIRIQERFIVISPP